MQKFCILYFDTCKIRMQKFCRAIFPLNSLKDQQQMDNAVILHFKFDSYKIWTQKFCRAILPLNSLNNQQQMDNAEILHFNFEKYKIWMQKFCRASFGQIHYKNNITKLVSKCAGGKTKNYWKRQVLMFYRPGKNSKNLRGGGGQLAPPLALIRPRVKLEFPAVNFSLRKQPSLLSVLV